MTARAKEQRISLRGQLSKEEAQMVNEALSGLSSDGAVWRSLMLLVDVVGSGELANVLQPNISNDSRNYNAGRATMMPNFKEVLLAAQRGEVGA